MKKAIAVMVAVMVLAVCGAGMAEKTKNKTKTTTKTGPKTVWLTTLQPVDGSGFSTGSGQLDGIVYTRALTCNRCTWINSDDSIEYRTLTVTYNLAKKYDVFEGYFGVDDDTGQEGMFAALEIIGDNHTLYSSSNKKLLDKPDFINISVKGVVRLKFVIVSTTKNVTYGNENGKNDVSVTIGAPKLIIGATAPKKETTTTANTKTTTSETAEETESGCEGSSNIIIDSKSLETLANNLAKQVNDAGLAKNGKVQLAITKFKLVSICKKSVADDVLDDLSTYLLKTKVFKLIEREQLEKAIKELKFNLTGFIEPKKAIELGKMVGAQAILIGSVSDRGTSVMVNARIINTKTGEADIAENVEMKK